MVYNRLFNDKVYCFFCYNPIVTTSPKSPILYQIVQLKKGKKYFNKCSKCDILKLKSVKSFLNRELGHKLETKVIKPESLINIKIFPQEFHEDNFQIDIQ